MSYIKQISNGIKQIRLKNNMTQEQFAEIINLSVQGYRNIEHAKYLPTGKTIDRICENFKINPIDLLLPENNENLSDIQTLVINKIKLCNIDKLIKINNMIDII